MNKRRKTIFCILAIGILLSAVFVGIYIQLTNWGYARDVSAKEKALRQQIVDTAEKWLGCKESDGSYRKIIDLYNSHKPLAMDYTVKYTDEWCATFVSAAAIQCGMTDIIPTECGCQRQIALFMALGCWVEADDYIPLPGDLIYYCQTDTSLAGDCTGRSDHIGIVVGTNGSFLKVIEGNCFESVRYRYLPINGPTIRGFATPNYSEKAKTAR